MNLEFILSVECFSGLGVLRVMAPVLATFLFIVFVFMSLLIFKRHGKHTTGIMCWHVFL